MARTISDGAARLNVEVTIVSRGMCASRVMFAEPERGKCKNGTEHQSEVLPTVSLPEQADHQPERHRNERAPSCSIDADQVDEDRVQERIDECPGAEAPSDQG